MGKVSAKELFEKLFNLGRLDDERELIDVFVSSSNSNDEQKILKDLLNRSDNSNVILNGLSDELFGDVIKWIQCDTDSDYLFDERDDYFPDNAYYALSHFMFDAKTELGCIIIADADPIEYFHTRKSFQERVDELIKDWEAAGADS